MDGTEGEGFVRPAGRDVYRYIVLALPWMKATN